MEEADSCRRAALEAVADVEPPRLHEYLDSILDRASMVPAVLTLESAAAMRTEGRVLEGADEPPRRRVRNPIRTERKPPAPIASPLASRPRGRRPTHLRGAATDAFARSRRTLDGDRRRSQRRRPRDPRRRHPVARGFWPAGAHRRRRQSRPNGAVVRSRPDLPRRSRVRSRNQRRHRR